MTNLKLVSKRSKRLFTYFKALGNPIRFLIIYEMLDGRPYTKNEIVDYVSVLTEVPKTTVDRHFRTLLKYGIVRTAGKSARDGEKGRKPLLYVLSVDSLTFYANLFTYLLEGVTDKRAKLIEKSLDDVKALLNMVDDVKLKLYLASHDVGDEIISNLSKALDSCVPVFSLVREAVRPRTFVADCENALELLNKISANQVILRKISTDKMRELLYVAHIESNTPPEKLGPLLGIVYEAKLAEHHDLWDMVGTARHNDPATILKTLTDNVKCTEAEASYLISLANNIIRYLSSSITNQDLIRLILTL